MQKQQAGLYSQSTGWVANVKYCASVERVIKKECFVGERKISASLILVISDLLNLDLVTWCSLLCLAEDSDNLISKTNGIKC